MKNMEKGSASPLLIGVIVLIIIFFGIYIYEDKKTTTPPDKPRYTACTAEAKLCPDGSYVGRTGPKCEFSACPIVKINTSI